MNVLVILGHPRRHSYCAALAERYAEGARSGGAKVWELNLADLRFSPTDDPGDREDALEDDLRTAQIAIDWADHIALIYPTWWGTFPALLKGFIDRTLLSGFAFRYEGNKPMPEQLLHGRTGRIITTMDAPAFWYRIFQRAPGLNAMIKATLGFCGIKMRGVTLVDRVRQRTPSDLDRFLKKAEEIGAADSRRRGKVVPKRLSGEILVRETDSLSCAASSPRDSTLLL
jgi:putative NADPH-quinone reductase